MSYHIVNARIVNEGTVTSGDLSVDGGRILGVNVPAPPGADVIEAAGAYLLPGMIDDQVHFREPGFEHKATIATESRAAVAGGITSYLERVWISLGLRAKGHDLLTISACEVRPKPGQPVALVEGA